MRLLLSVLLVCATAFAALYQLTEGFTALTAETARRNSVAHEPRTLPETRVIARDATVQSLDSVLRDDGRTLIVNFIYTRCITLCLAMGSELQQLQAAILERGLDTEVRIVSISFDPSDTADRLQRYSHLMRAQTGLWDFYTIQDAEQRDKLLEAFGIIVIPAPYGEFEHNAAYHVVSSQALLGRIVDYGEAEYALAYALQLARSDTSSAGALHAE
ncbi:SCO family protein [Paenalcaligenes niemegkensis]|uniref:SCO family protein n=1 Tax=Paenalcaligenes niemegkensis TaxID=2895469 RepID=UPI001EE7DC47|nr:SCO family protein [Paenalcaligenes niemegkensis]MCQ9617260.1 SCO family protein [Paenalcaligenes niemegkensis]